MGWCWVRMLAGKPAESNGVEETKENRLREHRRLQK
jgi:hypothetical protein